MKSTQNAKAKADANATIEVVAPDSNNQVALLPYQQLDTDSGEVSDVFKYLEGRPRQYRFDAKKGQFNINGTESQGSTITFQPIAWRIFVDDILNMGPKNWIEIFFIDNSNSVSAVLFHGYSIDNVFRLIEPLFYDNLTLADVVITAVAEKKENTKIQPKGVYYIASFSYKLADAEQTKVYKQYANAQRLFRQDSTTPRASIKSTYNWHNPFDQPEVQDQPDQQWLAA
ncbi:hypothetical protein [Larkinella sp. C7]|uniref:hypothetical protein n=1 Tax=Larkinella sp. C7 TaxID=2576607 RepID=UPI001E4AE945|nr:hypothetical protein [Larkinella sp. C7]